MAMKSTANEPDSEILSYLSFTVLWAVNLYLAKRVKCVIKLNKKNIWGWEGRKHDKEGGI